MSRGRFILLFAATWCASALLAAAAWSSLRYEHPINIWEVAISLFAKFFGGLLIGTLSVFSYNGEVAMTLATVLAWGALGLLVASVTAAVRLPRRRWWLGLIMLPAFFAAALTYAHFMSDYLDN